MEKVSSENRFVAGMVTGGFTAKRVTNGAQNIFLGYAEPADQVIAGLSLVRF